MKNKLWKNQIKNIEKASVNNILADFSEPGTGKSRASLEILKSNLPKNKKVLLVAPKNLLRSVWTVEIEKYTNLTYNVILYNYQIIKLLRNDNTINLISLDLVKNLIKNKYIKYLKEFYALIIDESHHYKNISAKRTKAIIKLSNILTIKIILTGTPYSKVTDLWPQIYILDQGKRLGNSYYKFRNEYQNMENHLTYNTWEDKPGAEEKIHSLISDITVRHKLNDIIDIPDNHIYFIQFKPNYELIKTYFKLKKEFIIFADWKTDSKVSAVNKGVLRDKLLQVLSGAVYTDKKEQITNNYNTAGNKEYCNEYILLDLERYKLIADLVENREYSVIFYNWLHQKVELRKILKKKNIPFTEINTKNAHIEVPKYQEGKYQTVLLHANSSHGITLTRGDTTIWTSPPNGVMNFIQSKHRIYRGGQTKKTNTILVKAENTIEHRIYNILQKNIKKVDIFNELLSNDC